MHEKRLAARYFMLSFAIGFLVLSVAAMTAVLLLPPSMAAADTGSGRDNGAYLPVEEDALNLLLVLDVAQQPQDDLFALIRFDPMRGQIPVAVFPSGTLLGEKGRSLPLEGLYSYSGMTALRERLAKELGVRVERTLRLDGAGVARLVDLVGGVRFRLRESVTLSEQTKLTAGEYQLSGAMFRDLLAYTGYRAGEQGRRETAGDLITALINQNSGLILTDEADDVFQKLVNLAQTDLTIMDYQQRKPAGAFMARLLGDPAFPVMISGEHSDSFEAYSLSEATRRQLAQIFSSVEEEKSQTGEGL